MCNALTKLSLALLLLIPGIANSANESKETTSEPYFGWWKENLISSSISVNQDWFNEHIRVTATRIEDRANGRLRVFVVDYELQIDWMTFSPTDNAPIWIASDFPYESTIVSKGRNLGHDEFLLLLNQGPFSRTTPIEPLLKSVWDSEADLIKTFRKKAKPDTEPAIRYRLVYFPPAARQAYIEATIEADKGPKCLSSTVDLRTRKLSVRKSTCVYY